VGNTQLVPTNFTWVVDRTPPLVWPIILPPTLNNLVAFDMGFTLTEVLAGLWASVDGSEFQPVAVNGLTATLLVTGTMDGVHTLGLKGHDVYSLCKPIIIVHFVS
jgi:hypothetical protein